MAKVTNCPGQILFAELFTNSVPMLQMLQETESNTLGHTSIHHPQLYPFFLTSILTSFPSLLVYLTDLELMLGWPASC